jgi:hypothetical protein
MSKKIKSTAEHDAVYSVVTYDDGSTDLVETSTLPKPKKAPAKKPAAKKKVSKKKDENN